MSELNSLSESRTWGCFLQLMIATGVCWWTVMTLACCAGIL